MDPGSHSSIDRSWTLLSFWHSNLLLWPLHRNSPTRAWKSKADLTALLGKYQVDKRPLRNRIKWKQQTYEQTLSHIAQLGWGKTEQHFHGSRQKDKFLALQFTSWLPWPLQQSAAHKAKWSEQTTCHCFSHRSWHILWWDNRKELNNTLLPKANGASSCEEHTPWQEP